jgi:hypothetical protein
MHAHTSADQRLGRALGRCCTTTLPAGLAAVSDRRRLHYREPPARRGRRRRGRLCFVPRVDGGRQGRVVRGRIPDGRFLGRPDEAAWKWWGGWE